MTQHINPLRINVGFIVNAEAGYSRTFEFELPELRFPDDLVLSDVVGTARFSRTPQGLVADVMVSARTPGECSRCLDAFDQAIATQFTELYAFDERSTTEAHLLVPSNHQIDLSPLVREYMILDLPMNPLCRKDCEGLCPVCGINRNHESCDHQPDNIDPRFASLKDFLKPED